MMKRTVFTITLLSGLCLVNARADMASAKYANCYEDGSTLRYICLDDKRVRENGELKAAPLSTGSIQGVKTSSLVLVTNCKSGISTMQDNGINVAGGTRATTQALRELGDALCTLHGKKDANLRQFGK